VDLLQGIDPLLKFNIVSGQLSLPDMGSVKQIDLRIQPSNLVICVAELLLEILRASLKGRGDGGIEGRTVGVWLLAECFARPVLQAVGAPNVLAKGGEFVHDGEKQLLPGV
jgi:hypothetical protein